MRCCGHRVSGTRLAPRHRPLPNHLDWWYRPDADEASSKEQTLQRIDAIDRSFERDVPLGVQKFTPSEYSE